MILEDFTCLCLWVWENDHEHCLVTLPSIDIIKMAEYLALKRGQDLFRSQWFLKSSLGCGEGMPGRKWVGLGGTEQMATADPQKMLEWRNNHAGG